MAEAARTRTVSRARNARIETRVTAEQKRLIERAAALQGRSVTDFVLTSAQDAARAVIETETQFALSLADGEAFISALLEPRPVNDRLTATVRLWRDTTGI
jgi:uncharacterized protein (DUF1778 family)